MTRPVKRPARHRRGGRPLRRRYETLWEGEEQHPADRFVSRIPRIRILAFRLVGLSRHWQARVTNRLAFVRYEDLRQRLMREREELMFDLGWECGEIAGRAQWTQAARDPATRRLAAAVHKTLSFSPVSHDRATVVLAEALRALALGLRASSGPVKPTVERQSASRRAPARKPP